tara:strand:+ start:80 stop:193 length:114 start_codon:yes stop_codon:yes gene_type:complete
VIIRENEEDVGLFAAMGVLVKTKEQKPKRNFFHVKDR